jgi:bifunctional DNA-binding transcriptional regulator/antitoxin component of YhaV-PrlF toxin-antitoxin module
MSSKFIIPVQQYGDTEDYFIEIPQEITNELNWQEGDTLNWNIQENNSIIISKIKDSSSTQEESTIADYNWYTVKEEEINNYLESESEGKDFDTYYDDYIEATNEETFSPEGHEFP